MTPLTIIPYTVIALGIIFCLLALPTVKEATVGKLQERKILPVIKLKKRDRELIVGTGPQTGLLFFGISLILIGTILLLNK